MNWNTIQQSDDRAVSPVIGVILMVAVAVILAAIVSMLVMGMGQDVEAKPQASFTFETTDSNSVVITHDGGDSLDKSKVSVLVNGTADTADTWSDPIKAGSSYETQTGLSSGDVIKVTWEGDNGDTATLATFEVP